MSKVELIPISGYNVTKAFECWNMIYVISGEISATLNDRVYTLQNGDVMLASPDDFYYINENEIGSFNVLSFKSDDSTFSSKVLKLAVERRNMLSDLMHADDENQNQIFLQFLLIECQYNDNNIQPIDNEKVRLFREAVGLMERYVSSSLSVNELADTLGISISGLKRIFARFTGMGVHEYYLFLKIKKAKELLREGNNITRTAMLLQFSSQAYFSTAFKRVTGISAKVYSLEKSGKSTSQRKEKAAKPESASDVRSTLPDYLL